MNTKKRGLFSAVQQMGPFRYAQKTATGPLPHVVELSVESTKKCTLFSAPKGQQRQGFSTLVYIHAEARWEVPETCRQVPIGLTQKYTKKRTYFSTLEESSTMFLF